MGIEVQKNIPLATYTTLGVGGRADFFVEVTTDEELAEAVLFARDKNLSFYILGGGSNVLIVDEGLRGVVIALRSKGISHTEQGDNIVLTVEAGEILDDVVAYAVERDWYGIENLSHIPGTVGASPVQNVGAYGVEVKDVIDSVRALNTETGLFEVVSNTACTFGYRDSFFKSVQGKKYIVTQVIFVLSQQPLLKLTYKDLATQFEHREHPPTLQEVRTAVIAIRSGKFPNWHEIGTAGSFFKNPVIENEVYESLVKEYPELPGFVIDDTHTKLSLGWILDKILNLRGYKEGNIATYQKQALVLIADTGATATEVEVFANTIVEKIKHTLNVTVEWEVTKLQ